MVKVIKRDGREVDFDKSKIVVAIEKAMKYGSGMYEPDIAEDVADEILDVGLLVGSLSISQIEDMVYSKLVAKGSKETAKAYEGYRAVQEYKRKNNTTDESIMGLINMTNTDVMSENSNKNPTIASTQRDLIAGEVSKDIARRKLIPSHLIQAHDSGALHLHDLDYLMQPIFNCCVIDIESMLRDGTVINGKLVESPKSFQVACTVTTQIVAQIASNQYGGQSLGMIDTVLAPYAKKSYDKAYKKHIKRLSEDMMAPRAMVEEMAKKYADEDMRKEIKDGVQTIQYQINTLMTSNGQAPFLTMSLYFKPGYKYEYEASIIQEEILRQRLEGIKNEVGIVSTPAFPKIIYFTDEHNIHENSEYFYLTELAAQCTAKRLYPDYISMKKMRENYEGNVVTPMGCRAFLPPYKDKNGKDKIAGRFNLGVTTVNLPQIALLSKGDIDIFYNILDERLALAREMSMVRYNLLKDVPSDVSPIHWQYGAISRMGKGEKIGKLFKNKYATVTVGYIGMYEVAKVMTGESNTHPKGEKFTYDLLKYIKDQLDNWYEESGIYFALYGSPSESTAGRLCELDRKQFGTIKDITDKGYYVNSFHVDVREEIDAFSKLEFESKYQDISTGGCISYIEIPNMTHNSEAIVKVIQYMYDNITYAEFNTKSDNCHVCRYEGEITLNDDLTWECPQCHNKDQDKMNVVRRTCGYLGENFWSEGRTKDIKDRVLHL